MKDYQIDARKVAERMDKATASVEAGDVNVNVGTMMISEFKAVMQAHKMQLDQSRITGKPIENPLVKGF